MEGYCGDWVALRIMSSDDVGMSCVRQATVWEVYPLKWELVGEVQSLLEMNVTSCGPTVSFAKRRTAKKLKSQLSLISMTPLHGALDAISAAVRQAQ